ncbi:hypothetical protein FACS1894188_05330 [Clostridia bacterium]|nr:hypothetical protein FACS1894188_05330 [Clostridia bacterium]
MEMPIRAEPFEHQRAAYEFTLRLFGVMDVGEDNADDTSEVRPMRSDIPESDNAGSHT